MISSNWQCHVQSDSWKYQEGVLDVMSAANIAKGIGFPVWQMYVGDFLPPVKNLVKDTRLPGVAGQNGGSGPRKLAH